MREAIKASLMMLFWILILAAVLFALLPVPITFAQQSTIYDAKTGKAVGHITKDSGGTIIVYGADGKRVSTITNPQKELNNGRK